MSINLIEFFFSYFLIVRNCIWNWKSFKNASNKRTIGGERKFKQLMTFQVFPSIWNLFDSLFQSFGEGISTANNDATSFGQHDDFAVIIQIDFFLRNLFEQN